MLKKINIIALALGFLGFFSGMFASVTAITLKDLNRIFAADVVNRRIINNQRIFPLYIDSAQFGSDDVTDKVQYHAAYGKLYIPSGDKRAKTINFTKADKKYSLSITKENSNVFLPGLEFIVTTDETYSDEFEISISGATDPYLQKLNAINRGVLYTYLKGGQNVMDYSSKTGWQVTNISLGISKLQSKFGNMGIIPTDKPSFENNVDGKRGSGSCYVSFKITIDNRDLTYRICF